jgi:IclR family transcriptional regulator, pca regulon regulatory protein
MATPESESFVRTFARGLKVIEAMGRSTGGQTIANVAEAAAVPRTAARRFLMTLDELGFVKCEGRQYWLTPKVLDLGLAYLHTLPYWRNAQEVLEELCVAVRQSCAIAVLDGADVVYVQRLHSQRILPASPSLGSRVPAHAMATGRVLLSGLPAEQLASHLAGTPGVEAAVRRAGEQGHAWVERELDAAVCGLAVPVRGAGGSIVAAIDVSLPAGAYDEARAVAEFLEPLRQAAARLRAAS